MLDSIRNNSRSFGVKLIFGVIILVFVFWGVGNFGGGGVSSVAEVNGKPITLKDYANTYQRVFEAESSRNKELASDEFSQMMLKRQVLNQMIAAELWRQEAERLGLFISPHEIKASLALMPLFQDASGKFDAEKYLAALKAREIKPGQFEAGVAAELLVDKMQRYVLMSVDVTEAEAKNYFDFMMTSFKAQYILFAKEDYLDAAEVTDGDIAQYYLEHQRAFMTESEVSLSWLPLTIDALAVNQSVFDEEIENYYNDNPGAFTTPERYHVRHIFFAAPKNVQNYPKILANAQSRMDGAKKRLAAGESFSDLAIELSDDNASKMRGGDIGWLDADKIAIPELKAALGGTAAGEVSEVVVSDSGLHLLMVDEKEAPALRPFEETKDEIAAILARRKAEAAFSGLQEAADDALVLGTPFEELSSQFKVEVKSTGLVAEEAAVNALELQEDGKKLLREVISGIVSKQIAERNQPAGNAQEGEDASSSMVVPVPLNIADGVALVRVDEVKAARILPLDQVRPEIEATLKAAKSEQLAAKAAEEALPQFTGTEVPEAYADKVLETENFSRVMPLIPSLGDSTRLAEALLAAPNDAWLQGVFKTANGTVIARISGTELPDEKFWTAGKQRFMQEFKQSKALETANAFLLRLQAEAAIEEIPGVLEQIRFR